MARDVNGKLGIEIHQALHGYADGHRQLAISTKLEPADAKLLLTFSDISGPGVKPDSGGYLTGFPLSASGYFALAKTWLAVDMPRPGCVWTHTLLVSFSELANIESLEGLNDCFKCPKDPREFDEYRAPLECVFTDWSYRAIEITAFEILLVKGLYDRSTSPLFIERPDEFLDETVLTIWSQQWPRLRRSFSFCSLCTRDRSSNGVTFDLQIFPSNFLSPAKPMDPLGEASPAVPEEGDWLLKTIRDLEQPNGEGLRSFLKLVGSDVEGGREAFRPLCTLFTALEEGHGGVPMLEQALAVVESESSLNNSRTARTAVANVAAKSLSSIDEMGLSFLWSNIEFVDKKLLSKVGNSVVQALWRRMPEGVALTENQNSTQLRLIHQTVEAVQLAELLNLIIARPELEFIALEVRPEITQEAAFWRNTADMDRAVGVVADSSHRNQGLRAMIAADRKGLPGLVVGEFEEMEILSAVADSIDAKVEEVDFPAWIVPATRNPAGITQMLQEEGKLDPVFLTLVADCVTEETVPNSGGEDPWLIALSRAGTLDDGKPLDVRLAAFVLSRALGGMSKSPGGLVRAGFDSVDGALSEDRLSEKLWQKLERHLPYPIFWLGWSRTNRFRAAVAEMFVDRRLPAEEFVRVTRDFGAFKELIRQMSWSRSGRKYLKGVGRFLNGREKSSDRKGKERKKSKMIKAVMREIE